MTTHALPDAREEPEGSRSTITLPPPIPLSQLHYLHRRYDPTPPSLPAYLDSSVATCQTAPGIIGTFAPFTSRCIPEAPPENGSGLVPTAKHMLTAIQVHCLLDKTTKTSLPALSREPSIRCQTSKAGSIAEAGKA